MSVIGRKVFALLVCAGLGGALSAQQMPIGVFPYSADFGTSADPGEDNSYWKMYGFVYPEDSDDPQKGPTVQWDFADALSDGNLAPRFREKHVNGEPLEETPALFSPQFYMEKDPDVAYTVTVSYFVPQGKQLAGDNLYVRIHRADGEGEPFFAVSHLSGDRYMYNDPVIRDDNGTVQSVLLAEHIQGLREGVSTYTYTVYADRIPESGNYRFAFMVLPGAGAINPKAEFCLTALTVEEKEGVDLAAGQILSPYSGPDARSQPFSAFVRNLGISPVDRFTACYQVDNRPVVRQEFSGMTIASRSAGVITFREAPGLEQGDHTFRFWVELPGDIHVQNDTSSFYTVRAEDEVPVLPVLFDFSDERAAYAWNVYSDTMDAVPSWTFVGEDGFYRPSTRTEREGDRRNDDYLVSPLLPFGKDRLYRIEFDYRARLTSDKIGDKSLSLSLSEGVDRFSATKSANLIWQCGRFDDTGLRKIVLYYRSREAALRALVFHSFGPSSDGGLQLDRVRVSEADTNRMDFYYDFDSYTDGSPVTEASKYMDFVDQDGNVYADGTSATWEVVKGRDRAHNSEYCVRSAGFAGKTDDWMVFKPVQMFADTVYYLTLYAKSFGTAQSDPLSQMEIYLQYDAPRYDLDFDRQSGLKWKKEWKHADYYDTLHKVFSVPENGLYILSVRNATRPSVSGETDTLFIDNISLTSSRRNSVQAVQAEVPYEARMGQQVQLEVTIRNYSGFRIPAENFFCCYQIDSQPVCREKGHTSLAGQAVSVHKFSHRADFSAKKDQTVRFWVEMPGLAEKADTLTFNVAKIYPAELPFMEPFAENSLQDWRPWPADGKAWSLVHGEQTAHSGEWALRYTAGDTEENEHIVVPLLRVDGKNTYRVSFYYKRLGETFSEADSLSLSYAYNRYDQTGFRRRLAVFPRMTAAEYTYAETYVQFPDTGSVFLALGAGLSENAPALLLDDFLVVDSAQARITKFSLSGLSVSGNLSECDTASSGKLSFRLAGRNYTVQDRIPLYVRYDTFPPWDITLYREVRERDTLALSFEMPVFSAGEHRVRVWMGLPYEEDRSDDTLSLSFTVREAAGFPFVENTGIRSENGVCMTGCFRIEDTGRYTLRYGYEMSPADEVDFQVHLLYYGTNRIEESVAIDTVLAAGREARKKDFSVDRSGVYALSFECISFPDNGVLRIDSISVRLYEPDTTGSGDTVANRPFVSADFSVRPNPASDRILIRYPGSTDRIRIFDIHGRLCREIRTGPGVSEKQVSLYGFRPGMYFIRFTGKNATGTVKFVKR